MSDGTFLTLFKAGMFRLVRYLIAVAAYYAFVTSANLFAICLVGGQYAVVTSDDDEALVYRIENIQDELFALADLFLRLPALGNVLGSPEYAECVTVGVPSNLPKGLHHPLPPRIIDDPDRHMKRSGIRGQRLIIG